MLYGMLSQHAQKGIWSTDKKLDHWCHYIALGINPNKHNRIQNIADDIIYGAVKHLASTLLLMPLLRYHRLQVVYMLTQRL